jgi:hypothetical protein
VGSHRADFDPDEVALLIFRQLIDPTRYNVEVLSAGILVSEMTATLAEKKPPLVCISALPPGGVRRRIASSFLI